MKIPKDVDEKWKLWKKRNNEACDTIDRNRFKKKKKKISNSKSNSVDVQDDKYKFKDKNKLSQFKKK